MKVRFDGKLILISGVTGAIGEAVARKCSSLNAEVYGIYGKDIKMAKTLRKEKGIRCLSIDFTKEKISPDRLKKNFGSKKIYALVNALGLTIDRPLIRLTEKDWDDVVNLNLTSVFQLTRAMIPLIAQGGRIINLSSSAGLIGAQGQANYASAKAGLWAFTKSLAREAAKNKIMVNLVLPGFVPSKMTGKTSQSAWQKAKEESLTGEYIKPEVVADFIVFLVSGYSQGITGQAFNIDNRIRRWW